MVSKKSAVKKRIPKKRNYKKKRGVTVKNSVMTGKELTVFMKSPVSSTYTGIFRYAGTFTLTTGGAGVMGTQQAFRLNNLYDPDYTGSGHQPYGFDQIYPLYQKYQVNKCKATLIWMTSGGTAELIGAYKCQVNSNAGNLTGITCDYATEQPQTSTVIISGEGNNRVVEQNFTISIPKLFGIKKTEYKDDAYISQNYSGSEPVNPAWLIISAGSPSAIAGQTVLCQVILEYHATFFGRIDQTQS